MNSRPVVWRRPVVAPVYAAAIAFGAVALASLFVPATPTVTVTGDDLPATLTVRIEGTAAGVDVALSEDNGWSAAVPTGAQRLCLDPPLGWVVTGPRTTAGQGCVDLPDALRDVEFTLVRSR